MAINKTQVFNAADAISATGTAPTVAGVRARIGSGSYTTITEMLRSWKLQAVPKEADDDESDVPEEITEALARCGKIVWQAAQEFFKREVATIRKDSQASIQTAQAQTAEAFEEIDRLEAEAVTASMQLENREKQALAQADVIEGLKDVVTGLKIERAEALAQLKAMQTYNPKAAKAVDKKPLPPHISTGKKKPKQEQQPLALPEQG